MKASLAVMIAAAAVASTSGALKAQTCTDPHYRWTEKTDTALAALAPVGVTVTRILTVWEPLGLTSGASSKCTDRAGRELRVYRLRGWARRVRKDEDDGDWHVEVTALPSSRVDSCVVVEIPPVELGALYAAARHDFDSLTATSSVNHSGDISPPVRLRFTGPAFFDGEHRGGAQHRDRTDGSHGRCNASARALWEIHPVYRVARP